MRPLNTRAAAKGEEEDLPSSPTRAAAKGGVEEDFFFSTFAFATRKLGEERMFFE